MSTRLVAPWKRSNSANLWFRMVVPPRFREALGKSEIKQSLATSHLGDARRLCAQLQAEWLERFDLIAREQEVAAATQGVRIVDQFLDEQADRDGGLDAVMAYELEDLALAEASFLLLRDDDEVDLPGGRGPVLAHASPGVTDLGRAAIELRRSALRLNPRTAALPGREAARRARADARRTVAAGFLEEAFNHAGVPFDPQCPKFAIAADRYLERLLDYRGRGLDEVEAAFPLPADPAIAAAGRPSPVVTTAVASAFLPSPVIPASAIGAPRAG